MELVKMERLEINVKIGKINRLSILRKFLTKYIKRSGQHCAFVKGFEG